MWKQYKHRFVPWLVFNWKNSDVRIVKQSSEEFIEENVILDQLFTLLMSFERSTNVRQPCHTQVHERNCSVMEKIAGFNIKTCRSKLKDAGTGVVLAAGSVKKGQVVAMYPGTVYQPSDPLFFQSFRNPFILQCFDGIFVDGNHQHLSKYIYKSCVYRDKTGYVLPADLTWLQSDPVNPLSVGHYVNNHTVECPANVVYRECNLDLPVPDSLLQILPNVNFAGNSSNGYLRLVLLIAIKDITAGEELFSSYFTLAAM